MGAARSAGVGVVGGTAVEFRDGAWSAGAAATGWANATVAAKENTELMRRAREVVFDMGSSSPFTRKSALAAGASSLSADAKASRLPRHGGARGSLELNEF